MFLLLQPGVIWIDQNVGVCFIIGINVDGADPPAFLLKMLDNHAAKASAASINDGSLLRHFRETFTYSWLIKTGLVCQPTLHW